MNSDGPLSTLNLPRIVRNAIAARITKDQAQQTVSYACWQQRLYDAAQGDQDGDWYQAAMLLNGTMEAEDLDALPW